MTPLAPETHDSALLLCDPTTPSTTLVNAPISDALFALAILVHDEENRPEPPDGYFSRRGSLFTSHPRHEALGDLFLATLRDPAAAVSAMGLLNTTGCTWSVLVTAVRRHDLTPGGKEATTEDVIVWLGSTGHHAALEQAIRLALVEQPLVRWLDTAWRYVTDTAILTDALQHANVVQAPPIASRLVELLDHDELLDAACRLESLASTAQGIVCKALAGKGLVTELVFRAQWKYLDPDAIAEHLTNDELIELATSKLLRSGIKAEFARKRRARRT